MWKFIVSGLSAVLLISACGRQPESDRQTGVIANPALDEASGMQAGRINPRALFLHNDDGQPLLYVIDREGHDLGEILIGNATNRDWEDITLADGPDGPLLVVADTGDNFARREDVALYFLPEPLPGPDGRYAQIIDASHVLRLRYPDGPRDCESVAFDPTTNRLLFLTKRDTPPRLYAVGLEQALQSDALELEFLGVIHRFRSPTAEDMRKFGPRDGPWVSQPTALDISRDGRRAAVISYRSLYLFERAPDQDWLLALQGKPMEIKGPPALKEEAVAFAPDGNEVLVTTEGVPAPVYAFPLSAPP